MASIITAESIRSQLQGSNKRRKVGDTVRRMLADFALDIEPMCLEVIAATITMTHIRGVVQSDSCINGTCTVVSPCPYRLTPGLHRHSLVWSASLHIYRPNFRSFLASVYCILNHHVTPIASHMALLWVACTRWSATGRAVPNVRGDG